MAEFTKSKLRVYEEGGLVEELCNACKAWEKFVRKLPAGFEMRVSLWHQFNEAKELTKAALSKARPKK